MKIRKILIIALSCLLVVSCGAKKSDPTERLSVGKVQREIRVGMTTSDVVQVMGSPNMVSTDEGRREVWVYDKVATEHAYKDSSSGMALILAPFKSLAAAGGLSGSSNSGSSSSNQRTLTVVVKFDDASRVRDFSYHTSTF